MKQFDILALLFGLAACIVLFILADRADRSKSTGWKRCWLIPLLTVIVAKDGPELSLLPLYLGSLIALTGFFTEQKKLRQRSSVIAALCMLLTVPVCLLNPRYRAIDYKADFQKAFDRMRRHYVLSEHKNIDWDALYAAYMPQIEEAERTQDAAKNYYAWAGFTAAFHDGHVSYAMRDREAEEAAVRAILGNDYGLAVMRLTDGRFAAVNTDDSLKAHGITNGTIITKWNGMVPDEASKTSPAWNMKLTCIDDETENMWELGGYPDIDNEIFYSGLLAAGLGDETASVSYLDAAGKEQTVTLPKLGEYADRLFPAMETIDQGLPLGNLTWQRIGKTTACLRVTGMSYDSKSYASDKPSAYTEMTDQLKMQIQEYMDGGVQDYVIDLRNNSGGSPHMVNAMMSLFAPEGNYPMIYDGVWDDDAKCWKTDENGKYLSGKVTSFNGEDFIQGGRVILLVNANTVSAGDYMVKAMRGLPNVTVIGFTQPNGSCQAVGGLTLDGGALSFSNCVNNDADGNIFIDSGTDRQSTDDLDVQIPFDEQAIRALFDDGEDYAMQQALALIK